MPLTVVRVRRRFNSESLQGTRGSLTCCPQCKNRVLCPVFPRPSNLRRCGYVFDADAGRRCILARFRKTWDNIEWTALATTTPSSEQGSEHMANTAQTRKRARQAEATRQRNASLKSALRTAVKKVKKAIAAGDKAAAGTTLRESQAVIDRIADKRIVHKNLASRTKSRLAHAIKALP